VSGLKLVPSGGAAVVLTVPALYAAFIFARLEHALVRKSLVRVQRLVGACALITIASAASLVMRPSGKNVNTTLFWGDNLGWRVGVWAGLDLCSIALAGWAFRMLYAWRGKSVRARREQDRNGVRVYRASLARFYADQ
jgi:hypothetical protein